MADAGSLAQTVLPAEWCDVPLGCAEGVADVVLGAGVALVGVETAEGLL
jgi:hypothetical protein